MRIYVPNLNKGGVGGGPTFVENFLNGLSDKHVFQDNIADAELMFVPNPMWAERSDFEVARERKVPIVLRLDNIPEDWNNRGTSISKLKDFIAQTDYIIFQSDWSRQKYVEFASGNGLILPKHSIVQNGVDTRLFAARIARDTVGPNPVILFVKSGRNENKRWMEAMEIYRRYWYQNKNAMLYLVGQFADDHHRYNFGFYNGERFKYLGILGKEEMAAMYQLADILLFPAFADCAPNVVLESMSCGTPALIHPYGGGIDFVDQGSLGVVMTDHGSDFKVMIDAGLAIDRALVRRHIENNFSLEIMSRNYEKVFEEVAGGVAL